LISKTRFYLVSLIDTEEEKKTRSHVITRSENDACNTPLLVDDKSRNEEEEKKCK
jgi:hypothetical protein